ncbi:phenoloxidase-activating factor 2-like [Melitaea cinxia]|uniref:phenoloxidase-activating factor 2-like n=1 Tax=Melitaea cinxia TaxID=113334 RepID=UPI001E274427|nr:phenoloxidase-activating factor 2-like [Melitaea cinxia]
MLLPLFSILAMAVAYPQSTLDPTLLTDIFGTPPTPLPNPTNLPPKLEDITVRPTQAGQTFVDKDGEQCQCVPYYLCDSDLNAVYLTNSSIHGYGVLDIRFGEKDDCQESVERCCKVPKPEPEPEIPDPTKLKACGYRNPLGLDFALLGGNGNEAFFGEFPWVVALLNADNLAYVGVGVLIHPQVVMTGAHVVYKFAPGKVVARAGEWDTQTNKERLKSQERIAKDIVIREDFHEKSLRNDIALLQLDEPFQLAEHINTLCLPEPDEDFDSYKNCVANGWGKTAFGQKGRYAVILKKIEVDMVPFDRCGELLKRTRLGRRFKLDRSFVCAGGEEGKDTCQGDGGAPLACPVGNDRYKLAGLVAWGVGCGQKDVPAVYARVSMFRNWVDDVMNSWGYPTSSYTINE